MGGARCRNSAMHRRRELTRKAEDLAFRLARQFQAHLVGLFVVDPFLQKFTNEIYAVGREACRDHIDSSF